MKTSNKILSGLAICLFAGLLGSNVMLKAEYESRKKNTNTRLLKGFAFTEVPSFSHVRINSASPEVRFVVLQGSRPAIQVNDHFRQKLNIRVQNDTLLLEMALVDPSSTPRAGKEPVAAYIDTPPGSIVYQNGLGDISGFRCGQLRVACQNSSRVTLRDMQIDTLAVTTENRAVFEVEMTAIYTDKGIGNLYASPRDSSRILMGKTRLHGAGRPPEK